MLISKPITTNWQKGFDSSNGLFIITFETYFTYNSVFENPRMRLLDSNKGNFYNYYLNMSIGFFHYYNFSDIHDRIAMGVTRIPISPEWNNITIISEAELISNNLSSLSRSNPRIVDYRGLFEGNF